MGIKKLNLLLGKYTENSKNRVHVSEYSYKKIAIDANLYVFKYKFRNSFRSKESEYGWLSDFVYLICCLRKYRVHPVFVFDSATNSAPVEKAAERKKRSIKRKEHLERVERLERSLAKYCETGEIDDILRKNIDTSDKKQRLLGTGVQDTTVNVSAIKAKIEKMRSQMVKVCETDFNALKCMLDLFEVVYIVADSEGEALCCHLCNNGLVDAVLSDDTDVFAYGAKTVLSSIDTVNATFVKTEMKDVLGDMKMTQSQFLDMCILCGTDYNENMKGVGPEKSYQYIVKYKSLENVPGCDIDYKRVRELFTPQSVSHEIPYCGSSPDMKEIQVFLAEHSLFISHTLIQSSFLPSTLEFLSQ